MKLAWPMMLNLTFEAGAEKGRLPLGWSELSSMAQRPNLAPAPSACYANRAVACRHADIEHAPCGKQRAASPPIVVRILSIGLKSALTSQFGNIIQ